MSLSNGEARVNAIATNTFQNSFVTTTKPRNTKAPCVVSPPMRGCRKQHPYYFEFSPSLNHFPETGAIGGGRIAKIFQADVRFRLTGVEPNAPEWNQGIGQHGIA